MKYKSNNNVVYSCKYHVVFCPKYRRSVLVNGVKEEIYKLFQSEKKLPDILRNAFENVLKRNYQDSIYPRNDNKSDTRVLKKQLVENVANECAKDYYYGGLVGVRGGLTTYIIGYGRTGKYVIDLLEAAYNQFSDNILKVCECIESPDENYKEKIYEYLKIVLTKNAFSYSCTNMMINSDYLKMAWDSCKNKSSIRNKLKCDNDNKVALVIVYYILIILL